MCIYCPLMLLLFFFACVCVILFSKTVDFFLCVCNFAPVSFIISHIITTPISSSSPTHRSYLPPVLPIHLHPAHFRQHFAFSTLHILYAPPSHSTSSLPRSRTPHTPPCSTGHYASLLFSWQVGFQPNQLLLLALCITRVS